MSIESLTVIDVRKPTEEEKETLFLNDPAHLIPDVLELDDESVLFPGADPELNRFGNWGGKFNSIPQVKGASISSVAPMSQEYVEYLGWDHVHSPAPPVVTFSNQVKLYPSRDSEGNGPGVLFQLEGDQLYSIEV